MKEKIKELVWKAGLFIKCVSYDVKSAVLKVRIGYTRMKIKAAKKLLAYLRDE